MTSGTKRNRKEVKDGGVWDENTQPDRVYLGEKMEEDVLQNASNGTEQEGYKATAVAASINNTESRNSSSRGSGSLFSTKRLSSRARGAGGGLLKRQRSNLSGRSTLLQRRNSGTTRFQPSTSLSSIPQNAPAALDSRDTTAAETEISPADLQNNHSDSRSQVHWQQSEHEEQSMIESASMSRSTFLEDATNNSSSFVESSRICTLTSREQEKNPPSLAVDNRTKEKTPSDSFFGAVMRRSQAHDMSQKKRGSSENSIPSRSLYASPSFSSAADEHNDESHTTLGMDKEQHQDNFLHSKSTPDRQMVPAPSPSRHSSASLSRRYCHIERDNSNNNSNSGFDLLSSPGGKALMNILQDATTKDAFSTLFIERMFGDESDDDGGEADDNYTDKKHDLFASPRPLNGAILANRSGSPDDAVQGEDWFYTSLDWNKTAKISSCSGVKLLDQSLKSRVTIECHPGSCLPGSLRSTDGSSMWHTKAGMESLAVSYFLMSTNDKHKLAFLSTLPAESQTVVQWKSATMYWQHPSQHPLPQEFLSTGHPLQLTRNRRATETEITSEIATSTTVKKKKESIRLTVKSVLQDSAACFKLVRGTAGIGNMGGLGFNQQSKQQRKKNENPPSMSNVLLQRHNEWRACFRSMFVKLLERIRQLNAAQGIRTLDELPSFYALNAGQTVLFSTAIDPASSAVDGDESSCPSSLVPQIILSSTSHAMRQELRKMGVSLFVRDGLLFEEDEGSFGANQSDGDNNPEDDHVTDQEMEALRQGTTGDKIGILSPSLSRKKRRKSIVQSKKEREKKLQMKQKYRHSLVIFGFEDCQAFYEYFLNSTGTAFFNTIKEFLVSRQSRYRSKLRKGDDWSNIFCDVPLLICRSAIGPCLHMTLHRLSCISQRTSAAVSKHDNISGEGANLRENTPNSFVELRGPIMPCAARELVACTASTLHLDAENAITERTRSLGNKSTSCDDHGDEIGGDDGLSRTQNEDVGSHYFVAHFQRHEGESLPFPPSSTVNNTNLLVDAPREQLLSELTGNASSLRLNGHHGGDNLVDTAPEDEPKTEESSSSFQECAMGQVVSMFVWDSARPESLAFRVDHASAIIDKEDGK
jgi:hypothetical protein